MASSSGIDDAISVGKLCWELYSKVYKVSRDAPEELRGLSQELGNLHNTIQLLTEELKDEGSTLLQSGEVRISSVRRIMEQSEETLNKMQRLSERYVELQTPADAREKRRTFRILWDQLKYSRELHNINDLRSKLMLHNSQLTLILQGAQNSSLERIEKQNAQTDKKLDELRQMFTSDRAARDRPLLTAPLDPDIVLELTNIFLQKAESDNRPWASIGIDDWLQAGRWWLMKAQSQLDANNQHDAKSTTYNQGYANLLKACWILTDIIAIHPQRTHIGSSNDQRAYYIQRFAQAAISRMKTIQMEVPKLGDFRECNLDIWNPSPSTTVAPRIGGSANQARLDWRTHDGEIVFQRFAEYDSMFGPPVECIIILEILRGSNQINLIVQNFMGQDIWRYEFNLNIHNSNIDTYTNSIRFVDEQDMRLLQHVIASLRRVRSVSLAKCSDVSMVYSMMVLERCVDFQYALDDTSDWNRMEEDIGFLMQSQYEAQISPTNPLSSHLQIIADRAINDIKQCVKGRLQHPNQMFWMQRHHCLGMLICRFFNTFEEFSEVWNVVGVPVIERRCTQFCPITTAVLQRDAIFLTKIIPYVDSRAGWIFEYDARIAYAICHNDLTVLQTVLRTKTLVEISYDRLVCFLQLACANFKKDHMSLLLSRLFPWMTLSDICQAIFWVLTYHGEQELRSFIGLLQLRDVNLRSSNGCKSDNCVVAVCANIIQKQSSKKLGLFLDTIQNLGIAMSISGCSGSTNIFQMALFPALISRDLSMLEVLFGKDVASTHMDTITFDSYPGEASKTYPPQNMPHWPLYVAIRLVCDSNVVEYLLRAGACLEQVQSQSCDGDSEILRNLRAMLSVEAARDDFVSMRDICYQLSLSMVEKVDKVAPAPYSSLIIRNRYKSFLSVWATTGHMILGDGYYHSLVPVEIIHFVGATNNDRRILDRYIKGKKTWPIHLQTQRAWDEWRLDVIDILERAKARSSECQVCKS